MLPDFTQDSQLNRLRAIMKAPLRNLTIDSGWEPIDIKGYLSQLIHNGVAEIDLGDIVEGEDGLLQLSGKHVLVYMRDQHPNSNYKFHFTFCTQMLNAQANQFFGKYVASTRKDGLFNVNYNGYSRKKALQDEKHLKPCIYCLNKLNYKNYRTIDNHAKKERILEGFDVKEYLELYPNQDVPSPTYTDVTAPINQYTDEHQQIAKQLKAERNYCCDNCKIDLSSRKHWLHMHHKNQLKYDNNSHNLALLCVGCHAEEYNHQHLKGTSEYEAYMSYKLNNYKQNL